MKLLKADPAVAAYLSSYHSHIQGQMEQGQTKAVEDETSKDEHDP
jgi:hypothetical protein